MAIFDEVGSAGGNKKKWIYIAIGTGIIAIFLVIRNSTRTATDVQAVDTITPAITDTGSYPSDSFGGGTSGTGMDQTLSTYLAIADQNSSIQMGALNNQLTSIQSQFKTTSDALQSQINAINSKTTVGNIAKAPQPPVTTTPVNTSHPDPRSVTHIVRKGETLSGITAKQYGKQQAYAKGIKEVASLNKILNPNKIAVGQKIILPAKL